MSISGPGDVTSAAGPQPPLPPDKSGNTVDRMLAYISMLIGSMGTGLNTYMNKVLAVQEGYLNGIGGISAGVNANFKGDPNALQQALQKFFSSYQKWQKEWGDRSKWTTKNPPQKIQQMLTMMFGGLESPPAKGSNPTFSKDLKNYYDALVTYNNHPTKANWAGVTKTAATFQGLGSSKNLTDKDFFDSFQNTLSTLNITYSNMVQEVGNNAMNMVNMIQQYQQFSTKNIQRMSQSIMGAINRTNA